MPSHFIAFEISDKIILDNVRQIIEKIKERNPELAPSAVSLEKSHLSLLALDIPRHMEKEASEIFQAEALKYKKDFAEKSVHLALRGLDVITISPDGHQLLYSKVDPEENYALLSDFVESLKKSFRKIGLEVKDNSFFLHFSILNTSIGGQTPREIPVDVYKEYADVELGRQKVFSVQLLARNKGFSNDGYYFCESEFLF